MEDTIRLLEAKISCVKISVKGLLYAKLLDTLHYVADASCSKAWLEIEEKPLVGLSSGSSRALHTRSRVG